MTEEFKVAEEQAEAEFNAWLERMDIDPSTDGEKDRVIRAIMRGHLVFNDDGLAAYTPWRPASKRTAPLVFHEVSGADLMAAGAKASQGATKAALAMIASMCRVDPKVIVDLTGPDLRTVQAVYGFLAV